MGCLFKTCADSCSETEIADICSKDNEWHWMTSNRQLEKLKSETGIIF